MSVRGEYRRLAGDLLAALRHAGATEEDGAAFLEAWVARAGDELPEAAAATLDLLPGLSARAPRDPEQRRRFDEAYERLEAVCRIILGR